MSAATQSTSDFKGDHLSIKMLGAVGDGTTDDTGKLQGAIDFALSRRTGLYVPPGIYRTSAEGLSVHGSLNMYGLAGMGQAAPIFRHEGTGTALEFRNASSVDDYIFATHIRNLVVSPKDGVTGSKGIAMYTLSGAIFENVGVFGSPTAHFDAAWYLYQSGIIEIRRPLASYCPIGFWFDGSTPNFPNGPIIVDRGDLFQCYTAAFKVGYGVNLTFRDNWIEQLGVAVLIDNTAGDISVGSLEFSRNRVLLNGNTVGAPFVLPDLLLKVVAAGGKLARIDKLLFKGNDVLVADSAAHAVSIDYINGAFLSSLRMTMSDNFIHGYSGETIVCNDSRAHITLRDNTILQPNGIDDSLDLAADSAATLYSQHCQCVGRDTKAAPSNDTTAYFKDSAVATKVQIDEGPDQGFSSLFTLADKTGRAVQLNYKDGSSSWEGLLSLLSGGLPRFVFGRFSTETGGNSGSDFGLLRYADDGTFISGTISVSRKTGRIGLTSFAPGAAVEIGNPDATVPLVIGRAASGQTRDLLDLYNFTNTVTPRFAVDIDGNVTMGFWVKFQNGLTGTTAAGSPEGVQTALAGSFYFRADGGPGTFFYVKESGTGNTGWVAYTNGVLANTITPATKTKITYNAQGIVTAGAAADLSGADVTGILATARFPTVGTPGTGTKATTDAQGRVTALGAADLSGADVTGVLAGARFPALTGDITTTAGSLVATLKNTGTAGTGTKVTTDAQGRVTARGTTDLSGSDVTGVLAAARMPGLTGDVTNFAGSLATIVTHMQNRAIDSAAPNTGDFLKWDGTQWTHAAPSTTSPSVTSVTATGLSSVAGWILIPASSPAGLYRVTWYLMITTGGTGSSVSLSLAYSDEVSARSNTASSISPGAGQFQGGSQIIRSSGTAAITAATAFTGITVAPHYSMWITLERIL